MYLLRPKVQPASRPGVSVWRSLLPFAPDQIQIGNISLKIPPGTSAKIRRALYSGTYEAPELQLVQTYLQPSDTVMEVGTGLGLISTYCAQVVGGDRTYTFEANPAMVEPILTNYDLNRVCPHFENCMIGQTTGSELFYVGKHFWSSSILNKPEGARPINVKVKAFNTEVKRIQPSFVIIDIEGGEAELLQYANFSSVRKLMIELHPWVLSPQKLDWVKAQILAAGFRLRAQLTPENLYFER